MVPWLAGLYILLIGLAAWGSLESSRLRLKLGRPFARAFHLFVLLAFAYASVNFIGEVLVPAIFPGPSKTLVSAYLIIDLITIPLLGVLFYLLLSWVAQLLGRTVGRGLRAAFWGAEVLFLAAFIVSFVSYFVRGISSLTYAAAAILDGILLLVLASAVLALLLASPGEGDAARRRLARGLGIRYAVSLTILFAVLACARFSSIGTTTAGRILAAGLLFLINLPALFFLRAASAAWALSPALGADESDGLEGAAREAGLSDRENEIVRLIARGLDTREIGKTLFISPKTVKNHLTNIYAKTGARNRVQLVNRLRRGPDQSRPREHAGN